MKKFLIDNIVFSLLIVLLGFLLYFSVNTYLNRLFSEKDAVFVWGDSQAYRGIDLKAISNSSNKTVYSSAHTGSGVYDFLVFSDQVTDNSSVIVSLSKLVQIRRKKNDYNRTGLSFWALKKLYDNNYTFNEVSDILSKNLKPKNNIHRDFQLFPYQNSIEYSLPLAHFEAYYAQIPPFLEDKQNLYLIGINKLIEKNCKVTFIEFPYHSDLKEIEANSQLRLKTEQFKQDVIALFDDCKIDSIEINKEKNVFKDLSHLNELGAELVSTELGEKMLKNEQTTLYIAH